MGDEYFEHGPAKNVFKLIHQHVLKYQAVPSKTALAVALDNSQLVETEVQGASELINKLQDTPEDLNWLVAETERFVQESAMYNATSKIIEIQTNAQLPPEKRNKKLPDVGAIPDIMRAALSISFDSYIGHDWMEDHEARWLAYQNKARKVAFKLNILNRITKGGAETGTLNVLLAGVNVGKSLGLCSLAADYLQMGKNVLYISMEMAEEVCAKRIDANLLDVSLDDIDDGHVSYAEYKGKMEKWRSKNTLGRLIIKQYPTGGAHANTFRALLNELKLKKNFVPDVIIIDYLGICASCRIKVYTENSYTLVKAIAEELRALAVESETVLWTAAQTTRSGWDASDISMGDVAESAGLPATADFMLAVIETEELAQQGQQLIKQIKSRYGDKNKYNKFLIGVSKGNQRWVEIAQDGMEQPNTVNEASGAQQRIAEGNRMSRIEQDASARAKLDALAEDLKF
ncbi:DNA primase/helicase [Klebsiella phage vB_KpnM_VPA32]|nr:DNA primase/helicase [Klebsiella phage vB_KpnM_VPA32]